MNTCRPQEVAEHLGRTTITGKEAAALAAIHVIQGTPAHVDKRITLDFLIHQAEKGIMLGSSAGKQGLWLNVLEKGFGAIRADLPARTVRQEKALDTNSIDAISRGGNPVHTITLLTSRKGAYEGLWTTMGDKSRPPIGKEIPERVKKARTILLEAQERKRLVCCCTDVGKLPPGLVDNHAYAVLGIDKETSVVHSAIRGVMSSCRRGSRDTEMATRSRRAFRCAAARVRPGL